MSGPNAKVIRAMVLAVLAVCTVPPGSAQAQFRLWPQYGPWWGYNTPVRHKHKYRHRHSKPQPPKKEPMREAPKGPLQVIVSIVDQRISIYDNGALIARSAVSTGVPRHPTPLGVFSVIGRKRWHRSNLYSAAPMPLMQRLTWSGIALHAGDVPGRPASHGCIRLKKDFAVRLWRLTKLGTRVIIAHDDVRPVEIANPRLPALKLDVVSSPPESRAAIEDGPIMIAAAVGPPPTPDAGVKQEAPRPKRTASSSRRPAPISVFVSRKAGRLFVRQGFRPLFDAPVTIQDPQEPLGTHVFTAMGSRNEGGVLRWTVTSMPEKAAHEPEAAKERAAGYQTVHGTPEESSREKAHAALDRIEIPQHVVERFFERMTPGSSLIVSDYGISAETGKGTDFIVVTP